MAEKHYAFIKDGRVVNSAVFASQDDDLAHRIVVEQNYDEFVFTDDIAPSKYASYDGKTFTPPTHEYLIEIGIAQPIIILDDVN